MSIFRIKDGRSIFWQWDLGRKLIVDCPATNEVHFANDAVSKALVLEVYEADGLRLVDVPNILLQHACPITVYAYVEDGTGGYTKRTAGFNVLPRKKPEDYVYTETEVKSYKALEERIAKLEGTGGGSGSGITLPANAEIGQAIVVTAVDEQGAPTAWEYVDMPDALSIGAELGIIDPVTDADGALLTDETGAVYTL